MQVRVQKTIQGYREGLVSEEAALERLEDWLNNFDEVLRSDSIRGLIVVGGTGAARILLDFLGRCAWRDSKLEAIRALGNFRGEDDVVPVMARWCFDADIEIGQEAILALGGLGLKGAVDVLLHVLGHEPPQKKLQTIYSLGKLGSPRAVAGLLAELDACGDTNPLLTETLLLSLTDLRCPEAVDPMRAYVRSLIPGVRHSAVTGLGKLARPEDGVEKLLLPLVDDPDVLTGNLASWALFTIKTRARREPWAVVDDVARESERLLRMSLIRDLRLYPQDTVIEYLAGQHLPASETLGILAELETPEAVGAIVGTLASTADDATSLLAARYLAHVGAGPDLARVDALRAEGATPGLQGLLTVALAVSQPARAVDILLREPAFDVLDATDAAWIFRGVGRVAAAATRSPARLADVLGGLTEVLERVRGDANLEAALGLVRELGRGPEAEAARAGLEVLARRRDLSPAWRYRALAGLGTPDAAAELAQAFLSERDPDLLVTLVGHLGTVPAGRLPAAFLDRVASLLDTAAPVLQEACLHALGRLGVEGSSGLVIPFLEAADYRLVQAAVIALGNLGNVRSVGALGRLLEGSDRRILGRTLHALSQVGGAEASRVLLEFLARHPWDEEFGDKVLRSVVVPEPAAADDFVRLLEIFEERTGSDTLRERANRFKLSVLAVHLETTFAATLSSGLDPVGALSSLGIVLPEAREVGEAVSRARRLRSQVPCARTGEPALVFGLIQCCRALDAATELGLAAAFHRMREERVVYTVLENVGFAGSRSNAIDRSFFLDVIHGIPAVRQLRHFPDGVLSDILDILYKNQLHRSLLLRGFQRWALILLVFGREYFLERFKIPDLLGLPTGHDALKVRVCCELLALDDRKLRVTSAVDSLTVEEFDAFLDRTETVLGSLATLFGWRAGEGL